MMAILQAIRLTPLQVEQVLIWREEHLRNMLAVYEQRQQLNVEVTLLKHLPNVEPCFYCPQAFLTLDFLCRMDVAELKQTSRD